jgi:hypothetical protein
LNRGQLFSLDAVIAVGIFTIILISITWSWDLVTEKISIDNKQEEIAILSKNALSTLLITSGNPLNWNMESNDWFNSSNMHDLGVSFAPSIIQDGKISKLEEVNDTKYGDMKKLLGLRKYDFHLSFYIYDGDNYALQPEFEVGRNLPGNETFVHVINRYGLINNNWSKVKLKVWK